MSTAYFIVVNAVDPGFDTYVDGKALTQQINDVNEIATSLRLKTFEDFAFQDLSEYGGPDMKPEWFSANEGVNWISTILQRLQEKQGEIRDYDGVVEDLQDYLRVFQELDKRGLQWHLELDF